MAILGTSPTQRHLPAGASLQGGKYRIVKLLGQGGFGITYLAEHKNFGEVAVKELFLSSGTAHCSREHTTQRHVIAHFDNAQFEDFKKRFSEEARTLFKLRDVKGVVKVIDIFEENKTAYFSMEYIEGDKLEDYVKKRGRLPEHEGVQLLNSIGRTLSDIHKRNVLHRDIKPANIIVTPAGETYLIDFGIARAYADDVAETHTTFHSPRYSPPEQKIATSRMGTFSDVYSLGATAYFVLTGEPPQSLEERMTAAYQSPQYLVSNLSDGVNEAINRSLVIQNKDRTQNVDDFLRALGKPSVPRPERPDAPPPPQYVPYSDEVTKLFQPKKAPPKVVADDAAQKESSKAQTPPKNSVEDDKTVLFTPPKPVSPSPPKREIVEDDKTMLMAPPPPPTKKPAIEDDKTMLITPPPPPSKKPLVEDDKTMIAPLQTVEEPEIDEEKTLIFGQDKSYKEPEKPKLPFSFTQWIKSRDGRIIGTSVVLSILGVVVVLVSPLVCKPEQKKPFVPLPKDTTTVQVLPAVKVDTVVQVVPTVPVKDTVKKETKNVPVNVPAKNTKPKTQKEAQTSSSYRSSSSSSSINEVPVAQTPTKIESVTPNQSQVLHQGNGIILNRDKSCVIKNESGTYRRNRETNEWIEYNCIMVSRKEYSVIYYKNTNTLKIETKD